jgi:hypothetical protein
VENSSVPKTPLPVSIYMKRSKPQSASRIQSDKIGKIPLPRLLVISQ